MATDIDVHRGSLERMTDGELQRAISFGLGWLGGRLAVDEVTFGRPAWTTWGWGVVARIRFTGIDKPIQVTLPWLLDASAATSARTSGLDVRVGTFEGTFWEGRFRQPLVGYMWTPGVHRITWPVSTRNTYRALIVGEFGAAFRLRFERRRFDLDDSDEVVPLEDAIAVRGRYSAAGVRPKSFKLGELLADPEPLRSILTDPRRITGGPEFDLPELLTWLRAAKESDRRRWTEEKGAPPRALDPEKDGMTVPMDPQLWRERGLGDALSAAIATAVSRVSARIARREGEWDADRAVRMVRSAVVDAIAQVGRGDGEFSATVVSERPINTLGRLEGSRQRTFIGFGGLEDFQGRLDLRVQPPGWREQLCPLQTQESARIGLIRHSALSHWDGKDDEGIAERYSDLSAAAALIPFIGHDDPTRAALGSKMLKQAVILDDPEVPLVRTGAEDLVAESGVARAPAAGIVDAVDVDLGIITIGGVEVPVGSRGIRPELPGDRWRSRCTPGDYVAAGDVIALAPDVRGVDHPRLAYGVNAHVAFLAWEGLNYEDGIVISESFARRMSSTHVVRLSAPIDPFAQSAEELETAESIAEPIPAGTPVVRIRGERDIVLAMPETARLLPSSMGDGDAYLERGDREVRVAYEISRPLQIGDKLTTRHGGKGVITRIEPDDRMPRIDKAVADVLLNPLGVIRRLNMGTLVELAWSRTGSSAPVPRLLGTDGRRELARRGDGRVELTDSKNRKLGPAMAGQLYLVKLDHLAQQKGGSRDDAASSPVTFQPVRATTWADQRRRSSPQRIGEMEVWSLEAVQAFRTLDDLMAVRGVGEAVLRDGSLLPAGLRASLGYLAVAGVHFESAGRDITVAPSSGGPDEPVRAVWRGSGPPSGLSDVVATFGEEAREIVAATTKRAAGSDQKANPNLRRVADQVLQLALQQQSGADELVRYEIVLPAPVDHPWLAATRGLMKILFGLPPLVRLALLPAASFGGAPEPDLDPVRRRYRDIIRWVLVHDNALDEASRRLALRRIEKNVRALLGRLSRRTPDIATIAGRLSGKYGLLRRNGLGAAAIRSGRAVLVGDPTLKPDRVRIPRWMADDLGVDESEYGAVVIVNRQPTLHPYNLQALRAEPWDEAAVALHPILLTAIAGDFDGDTVAVHRLESEEARQEIWEKRNPSAALRSGASGRPLAKLDQDVQLGLRLDEAAVRARAESLSSIDEQAALQAEGLTAARAWRPAVIDLDPAKLSPEITWAIASEAVKKDSVRQWLDTRGTVIIPNGDLPEVTIEGNYLDGIDTADYFAAAQQAIAGLATKKLLTPFAGSLTRTMVRAGYEISITSPDCEAGPDHTPLDCLDPLGPCVVGYGDNAEAGAKVTIGEPVGVRAGLFIGEVGTQKALKAIHDRSGANTGSAVLTQLGGILIGTKQTNDDLLSGPQYRRALKQLIELGQGHPSMREVVTRMQLLLLEDFTRLLPDVRPQHAAVLIRRRFLLHAGAFALPEGHPEPRIPESSLLGGAVWYGELDWLVLALGLPAERALDSDTMQVRYRAPAVPGTERAEDLRDVSPRERLAATIRNTPRGGARG